MKKWSTILIVVSLIFVCFEMLTESKSILNSVKLALDIWLNNLFPALFPFFVLSEIMVKYGFVEFIGNLLKPIMNKVFKIKSSAAFVFVMSIISGNPANAKYTRELYLNHQLNEYEATKILCFSCFVNPLFILGTVSLIFLNNKEVGVLILICHYFTNIIIGLIMRNYHPSKTEKGKVSLVKALKSMHIKRLSNRNHFGNVLTTSLINSVNTLLLILGVITMFLVITTIIDNNISLSSVPQSILNGFFEMTQGLKYIGMEDIPLKLKCVLTAVIISFGGLSVHLQIIGILSDTKIKYLPFLCARVFHALIAGILVYIVFDIWINLF